MSDIVHYSKTLILALIDLFDCLFLILFLTFLTPNFTGWGRTEGGGNAADYLQQAMLPVARHEDCVRVNGYMAQIDKNSMICAGGQGKGGCQGDSGGPFVCEENGRWVLRGAVSWGHGMCRTDHYSVFARVSSFIEWINQRKSGAQPQKLNKSKN